MSAKASIYTRGKNRGVCREGCICDLLRSLQNGISFFPCFMFQLYNYFEDSNYVYLILEMCHNGEMSRYIKNRKKPFSEDEGEVCLFCGAFCINVMVHSINI